MGAGLVPAVPPLIQLSTVRPGRQPSVDLVLEPLHPHGWPREDSQLLSPDWLSSGYLGE